MLKEESLEDSAKLPQERMSEVRDQITEDLEAALAQFAEIAAGLEK